MHIRPARMRDIFTRLAPGVALGAIALFHPVWADAAPDDIMFAGSHAAHGNFRAWAQLTAHSHTTLARTRRPRVDRELLRWAFSPWAGRHDRLWQGRDGICPGCEADRPA